MTFSKHLSTIIFSDYPNLLCTMESLGEEMISFEIEGDSYNRIANAFEDTLSPQFYANATATISVLKTSDLFKEFFKQWKNTTGLDGTALVTLENGESIKMKKITFDLKVGSLNGTSSSVEIVLKGNIVMNQALLQ